MYSCLNVPLSPINNEPPHVIVVLILKTPSVCANVPEHLSRLSRAYIETNKCALYKFLNINAQLSWVFVLTIINQYTLYVWKIEGSVETAWKTISFELMLVAHQQYAFIRGFKYSICQC